MHYSFLNNWCFNSSKLILLTNQTKHSQHQILEQQLTRRFHFNFLLLKQISIIFFFSLPLYVLSQPTLVWAKQCGGIGNDLGNSIAIDGSSNVYSTGIFQNTVDFDPGIGVYNLTALGSSDIFITKFDGSGNFVWAKQLGGAGSQYGWSITLDALGNVYLTGRFENTVDFDPGPGIFNMTAAGMIDVFVCKLDNAGNFIWAKQLGSASGSDFGYSITIDVSGNVLITGRFQNTADFDPGPGIYNLTSASLGVDDVFISKLDALGNFIWAKKIGGVDWDDGYSILSDIHGNVYTTGYFGGTVDFDPSIGVYNLTSFGSSDIFISKLDNSGNFLWAKQLGGAGAEYGYSIAIDQAENIFTTGMFTGTADFDPGIGTYNLSSAGGGDIFISKIDSAGNFLSAVKMGGSAGDYAWSIAIDGNSNIYLMGDQYSVSVDYDPGVGVYNVNNTGVEANFIAKYDNYFNFLCAFSITPGHNETESNHQLALLGTDVFITATFTDGSVDFDPCTPVVNIPFNTQNDIYFAKYDMSGCSCSVVSLVAEFTASDTSICQTDCIDFTDASSGSPTTWDWTFSGSSTLTSNVQNPSNICYPVSGIFPVTLIVSNLTSSDTITHTIFVSPLPNVSAISNDDTLCNGSCTDITASGANTYLWMPGNLTGTTVSVCPLSTTTYTIVGTTSNGCTDSTTITITVNTNPIVSVLPNPTSICSGDSVILSASGGVTYSWTPFTGLNTTTGSSVIAYPTLTTTYTIIGTIYGCSDTTTVVVTVDSIPLANITGDTLICEGETTLLTASGGTTYLWSTGENTNSIIVNPIIPTIYTVTVSNGACSSTASITVTTLTGPNADAGVDTTISIGGSVQLLGTGGQTYLWSPSNNLSCSACPNPIASPTTTTTYLLIVTDANGCTDQDSVTVFVDELCGEVFVPNVFSPNADGKNDLECVYGRCIQTMLFAIYDRWGEKVFETSNPKECWNGVYKGKQMNTAVFVYHLQGTLINGKEINLKGNITLIR